MELNERADVDTSQIEDRRGGGGGGGGFGIPLPTSGGGIVGLVVTLLAVLVGGGFGVNAITGGDEPPDNGAIQQRCDAADKLEQLDCRNALYVNSIQSWWEKRLPQSFGEQYQEAPTVFFDQAVRSGCGAADSGVGPFYCPADHKVYIDLTFYRVLADQLGARGEFAQPYVLAHEYGHHVQSLIGTEATMRRQQERDPGDANALSVKLELQADCYAGAWAKNATQTADADGDPIFTSITDQDIKDGLDTAAAIGDDTLQQRSGQRVNPDAFTHGTSAQRQQWFRTGYDSGDPKACDTFGTS